MENIFKTMMSSNENTIKELIKENNLQYNDSFWEYIHSDVFMSKYFKVLRSDFTYRKFKDIERFIIKYGKPQF